jgi:hypothetical protein
VAIAAQRNANNSAALVLGVEIPLHAEHQRSQIGAGARAHQPLPDAAAAPLVNRKVRPKVQPQARPAGSRRDHGAVSSGA